MQEVNVDVNQHRRKMRGSGNGVESTRRRPAAYLIQARAWAGMNPLEVFRMKMRSLQLAVLALLVPAALLAQGNGSGRGMGGGRMADMSPYAMEVPPTADVMTKALGLTGDQAARYTRLRDAHVQATQALRDSVATQRAKAREAMQAGNREQGMEIMRASRAQGRTLRDAAKSFDSSVAALMTAEQKPRYESWKQAEMRRLMQERRQQSGRGRSSN